MKKPRVVVLMGSISDLPIVTETLKILKEFSVGFEAKVLSAHRTPEAVAHYVAGSKPRGVKVVIAAAGGAAALAGVVASHTTLPVIGIPIETKSLKGLDSLLSTVQMPAGVPVATMAIGKAGAKNAAFCALSILSLEDKKIAAKLQGYRKKQSAKIKKTKVKF
ncbi:5-(carboxyamino)imidazole ribonucleotide mutase [Candidatus Omnitrophota bacterium]